MIFQGTAGVITIGAAQTVNSLTFNTTGYKITANTSFSIAGSISLAANVNLIIGNGETANVTVGVGSISGGSGRR